MNVKTCKFARKMLANNPDASHATEYTEREYVRTAHVGTNPDGTPKMQVVTNVTRKLVSTCQRGMYQRLKRHFS